MPLADIPLYGAYVQRRQMNEQTTRQGEQDALAQFSVLQKLHKQQQAALLAQEEAKRKAGMGQPIGAGGLLMPDKSIVPPAGGEKQFAPPEVIALTERLKGMQPDDPNRAAIQARIKYLTERPEKPAAAEPAVTPVTIADPNDPSGTLVVDGRTNRVLGKGPKLTQTGATSAKLIAGKPQAKLRVDTMIQNLDRMDTAMADLDADPGLTNITGTIMGRTPNITNVATGAQAKLDSIKSQIFQSSLQSMREASKTGGAVGNVSDREGDKLERTLAALDQAQGTPAFKYQLKRAREQVKLSKELIQRAFDEQFGDVQDAPSAPAAGGWSIRKLP